MPVFSRSVLVIWRQIKGHVFEVHTPFFGDVVPVPWLMRCAIRDEKREGIWIFARVFEIGDGEVGHGIGFIGRDVDAFKFVFVIKSLIIAVVEVVGCPIVVKSQSVRAWGHELIGGILVKISGLFINFAFGCVNVPFADVGTIYAVLR